VSSIRTAVAVVAVTSAALAVPALADKPGDDDTTKTSNTTTTRDCEDGDTVFLTGPDTLWPPNHKMVSQLAVAQGGEMMTSLTLTPEVTDAMGGDGGTQHDPDVSSNLAGSGTDRAEVPFSVRAERSGKGLGRTYTFHWTAQFDDKMCSSADDGQSPFTIFVPHDQGQGKATGRQ
jgi:hypothetical protein